MAVREACGIFDVSHMGEIETSGPRALELLQRLLSNDVAQIAPGGAQYSVLCREDGGVLDDLFTYRLDAERYLTVTNAANHERDLAWFDAHARATFPTREVERPHRRAGRCSPCRARCAREIVQAISDAPLPARMTAATRRLAGAEVLVCGTGYTGEDGVELLCAPEDAPALWDELVRRGAVPAGLGARDTLRLEVVLPPLRQRPERRARADRGRPRLVLQGGHRLHRRRGRARGARAPGRPRSSSRSRSTDPGIARQGNPVRRRRRGHQRHALAVPATSGIGLAYVPAARAAVGTRLEIDVRGKMRPRRSQGQAALQKGHVNGRGQLPRRPALPPRARLGAHRRRAIPRTPRSASPGTRRTRSARSCSSTRPPSARRSPRTRPTPRSSRSRPSPTSSRRCPGEIVEVNEALAENPAMINEDPYGEGWLVKVRLSDPAEREPDGRRRPTRRRWPARLLGS